MVEILPRLNCFFLSNVIIYLFFSPKKKISPSEVLMPHVQILLINAYSIGRFSATTTIKTDKQVAVLELECEWHAWLHKHMLQTKPKNDLLNQRNGLVWE